MFRSAQRQITASDRVKWVMGKFFGKGFRVSDYVSQSLVAFAILQLVFVVAVFAVQMSAAQPRTMFTGTEVARETARLENKVDVTIAQLEMRQSMTDARIGAMQASWDAVRVSERLALLERAADEATAIRRVSYGVLAAVIAGLLAQLIQIRGVRGRRNRDDDE